MITVIKALQLSVATCIFISPKVQGKLRGEHRNDISSIFPARLLKGVDVTVGKHINHKKANKEKALPVKEIREKFAGEAKKDIEARWQIYLNDDSVEEGDFYCPAERYIPWKSLPMTVEPEYLVAAEFQFNYEEDYWNSFTSPVEAINWEHLYEDMKTGAETMGYDNESWDCCLNHYSNYDWNMLFENTDPLLELSFKILGWHNETQWTEEAPLPDTEYMAWSELNALEQAAADYICFDEYSWDGYILPWPKDEYEAPPSPYDLTCPEVRFKDWADLIAEEKFAALDLGYDEYTWNNYLDEIEELSYDEIIPERDWREAMHDLGYDKDTWDCCVNNYRAYSYNQLKNDKFPLLQLATNVLGFDETNWNKLNHSIAPIAELTKWESLTSYEKAAADYLCYYEENWNNADTIVERQKKIDKEHEEE